MNKTTAALASMALGLSAIAGVAQAAPSGTPNVDWTLGDLIAVPAAKAVLEKDLPQVMSYSGLGAIKWITVRGLSRYKQTNIDPAKLATIQADLAAVKL